MDSSLKCRIADAEHVQGCQARAARALLGWIKAFTAQSCGVGVNTLGRLEEGSDNLIPRTVMDIVRTFEANGIVFIQGELGSGVLLRDAKEHR